MKASIHLSYMLSLLVSATVFSSCVSERSQPKVTAATQKPAPATCPPGYCAHCQQKITPAAQAVYGPAAYEDQSAPVAVAPQPDTVTQQPVMQPPSSAAATPAQAPSVIPMEFLNTAPDGTKFYYIAPGDSLWKISRSFDVSIEDLKKANNMTSDLVTVGKKLIIPVESPVTATPQ